MGRHLSFANKSFCPKEDDSCPLLPCFQSVEPGLLILHPRESALIPTQDTVISHL